MSKSAVDTFLRAADLNLNDNIREGSMLNFLPHNQVVMTGDLHGHRRNFEKLIKYCKLQTSPSRHVILHEMIHEHPESYGAPDYSSELLLDAAKWKTFFPEQVHFLQSNHELAQHQNHEISKGGRLVTNDFERGVAEIFGSEHVEAILDAIDEFIASFPLAARSPNRIFFAHSLPDAYRFDRFNINCVHQPAYELDLSEGGAVYQMVWGRRHTIELLDMLGKTYDADFFILGHQPQDVGYEVKFDRIIILSSEHNHGVFLPINCREKYDIEGLVKLIRPYAGVM
ncbi:MAG: hypothetical protein JSV03_10860 [Planctomycetota bacterium]|nr:MAG: hypothetical protein JSV03_10860 [Planctomycetota bacterium]